MSLKGKIEAIIETVYNKNNYTLDKEVKEVLLSDAQHKLISAPAGGTKTTMTQLMVNLLKLEHMVHGVQHNNKLAVKRDRISTVIPANRILCIVYNRHNASDIDTVHARFYNLLTSLKFISPEPSAVNFVEPGVYATTLHAYAKKIILDNLGALKMRSFNLTKDEIINAHFNKTVRKAFEESSVPVTQTLINDIKGLYDLYVGLKLYETPIETPLTDSVQFELALQSTQVPLKYLRPIFENYDKLKKLLKIHEFSDMLRIADTLLATREDIREDYQNYFNIIVADEVQDFTPLMFSIYKTLVGPETKTITVGDPDQAIYSFLGAMEDSIGRFDEIMGITTKRFELEVNRRCRRETMPFALNVINAIPDRTPRQIRTTKPEGILERIEYKDVGEMVHTIDATLKKRTTGNVGILFRNKTQSIILSRYLYNKGIPVNYINAYHCMQHRIYTLFLDVLEECFINKSQDGLRSLFRILPFTKGALEEFFEFDEKTRVSKRCPVAQSWGTLDFTPLYANSNRYFSIHEQVEFVQQVARESSTITASDCVDKLLDMFYRNYFSHLTESKEDEFTELVLQWAKEDLGVGYTLKKAVEELRTNIYKYMGSGRKLGKINICTIHGTKGLEFNHVILNLEKDIVGGGVLSAQARKFQDDEENRLYYVGSTRQIDSITILCNTVDKHRLSDPKYFAIQENLIEKPKFSEEVPKAFTGESLAPKGRGPRGRRSMLLED